MQLRHRQLNETVTVDGNMWPTSSKRILDCSEDEPRRKKARLCLERRFSLCEEEAAGLLTYLHTFKVPLDALAHQMAMRNIPVPIPSPLECNDLQRTSKSSFTCTESLPHDDDEKKDFPSMEAEGKKWEQHIVKQDKEGSLQIGLCHIKEEVCAFSQPSESASSFKFVIHNLLADYYKDPKGSHIIEPLCEQKGGVMRHGFRFNPHMAPDHKMAELYAMHIRRKRLDTEDKNSVFVQDLYRYYSRACAEVLTKYFVKVDRRTYMFDGELLYVEGEPPEKARERVNRIHIRQTRKKKKGANARKLP